MKLRRWTMVFAGVLLLVVIGIRAAGRDESPAEVDAIGSDGIRTDEADGLMAGAEFPVESDYVYVPGEGDGEPDGETTFSVLGAVANPGMYARTRPDIRLWDAIGFSCAVTEPVKYAYVIRGGAHDGGESSDEESVGNARLVAIDMRKLFRGDLRMNVLIGPDDIVIVPGKVLGEYYVFGE